MSETFLIFQVILDLLARLGAFSHDRVKVVFIDTFHLFEETHIFLRQLEVSTYFSCSYLACNFQIRGTLGSNTNTARQSKVRTSARGGFKCQAAHNFKV
jgi:3'-phosphoadenosine 5'-phosphosulfate sulfotransferase (PAPS reductase)/FAD synthetase